MGMSGMKGTTGIAIQEDYVPNHSTTNQTDNKFNTSTQPTKSTAKDNDQATQQI